MLRPIDTQTIYQQTPEVSSRQQAIRQGEDMQQTQFAQILQKEADVKQETVNEVREDEKTDNDLRKRQGRREADSQKKYKKKRNDTKSESKNDKEVQHIENIDIKI